MVLREVLDLFDLLDSPKACGKDVASLFSSLGMSKVEVETLTGDKGKTDVVRITVPGTHGKSEGGDAPTLGILGTLGGIGARPELLGMVSDGDGALVSLAAGLKLARMHRKGDICRGDVIVATHVCPNAPTAPHEPTPFMGSPVNIFDQVRAEVSDEMDAILSVDTTRGNRVINHKGFAISPTVKEGYILRTSDDLLRIMESVTGDLPVVFPITTQDITPYGNGVYHINSILQPSVIADCPVVGVAITARAAVAGCATGASDPTCLESVSRFCVEVAKAFAQGACRLYDPVEFGRMKELYGSMNHLRTKGRL